MSPRFVVTRALPAPALQELRAAGPTSVSPHDRPLTRPELLQAARGATALVTLLHDTIDDEVLGAAGPDLRVVANVAVGYDNIDVSAAARRGVVVTNTPGVLTDATADLTLGLLLALTRRLGEGERLIRSGRPWAWHMSFMLGSGLQGKTLGVVGLGAIGTAVGRRARAFGMEIAYAGRSEAASAAELGAVRMELDELFACSDAVSLHCPLTPDTRRLVDARRLALMKPSAYLVNAARGPIVDEAALAKALDAGRPAGAALDVFEREPEVHPALRERDDVVLVPHLGSATVETRTAMALLAARNAIAVASGGPPLTGVAPPPI